MPFEGEGDILDVQHVPEGFPGAGRVFKLRKPEHAHVDVAPHMGRTAPDRFPELHVTIPQTVHAAVFGEIFGFRLRTPRDRIWIVVVDPRSAHKCLCRMDMGVDETGRRHMPFGIQAGVRKGRRQIGCDPDNPSCIDEYVSTNAGRCFHML